ncbi:MULTISPECIES: hypothetical protein [Streptomyces]|uniref:Uncharacterized protein n=1 Tax=Streptomyces siderophoricus TaxID=2802281 RepID=A0ABS1MVX7_9ACTN|nr:hypothetical protein [Streptomyces sp. 9-7]MBL1091875.1 hypothetical protein [Streptomyces sp. 9-7]
MVTNPVEVDDVYHATAKLFGPLLRRLFPPSGRRRADAVAPLPPPVEHERPAAPLPPVVRGEDTVLVRPYLVAYEQQYGLEGVA